MDGHVAPGRTTPVFRAASRWTALVLLFGVGCVSCARRNAFPSDYSPIVVSHGDDVVDLTAKVVRHYDSPRHTPSWVKNDLRRLYDSDPRYVEKILAALDDPHRDDRAGLIAALGFLGGRASAAVPRLMAVVSQQRPLPLTEEEAASIRASAPYVDPGRTPENAFVGSAAQALGGIGRPAVKPMLRLLETAPPEQARDIVFYFDSFGRDAKAAVPVLIERLPRTADDGEFIELLRMIRRIDPGALRSKRVRAFRGRVLAAASSADESTATRALALLPALGVPAERAVPATVRAFAAAIERGPDVGLGGLAFFRVIRPYRSDALPHLLPLANDRDPRVRRAAVALMASPGVASARAVPTLARALDDPDEQVRVTAADALGALGGRARGAIVALEHAAAADESQEVRTDARNALKRIRGG